jgi:hypothetical protein
MNIDSGDTPLVLLCPAWKIWGRATKVKSSTVILHSPADRMIPFAHSQTLVRNSGLPESALIVVGHDHRLADPASLKAMLETVAGVAGNGIGNKDAREGSAGGVELLKPDGASHDRTRIHRPE